MQINRQAWLDVINVLSRHLGKNDLLPGMDTFSFQGNVAYAFCNDRACIVPLTKLGELRGVVKGQELSGLLQKLTGETVDLETVGTQWVIKSGRTTAKLNLLEDHLTKYVAGIGLENATWMPLPEELLTAIKNARLPGATHVLRGPKCAGDCIYSTDSTRITRIKLSQPAPEFYLDDVAVDNLIQAKPAEYCVAASWVCAKDSEGVVLCLHCKDMATYPQDKVKAALEAAEADHAQAHQVKLPKALDSQVLERVRALAETLPGNLQRIQVGLSNAGMTLFSRSVAGSVEHLVEWDEGTAPQWESAIQVWLDPNFLEAHIGSGMVISVSPTEPRTVRFAAGNFTQIVGTVTEVK